jgi:hypothetical protein
MESKALSRRELLGMLVAFGVSAPAVDAFAQAGQATTSGGKVIFENDKIRVIEHVGKSRLGVCGTGYHTHPPHLTIAVTDIKAKVTLQGKEPFIAENKAGDVFWDPGGYHTVENVGSRDARSYLIEVKA